MITDIIIGLTLWIMQQNMVVFSLPQLAVVLPEWECWVHQFQSRSTPATPTWFLWLSLFSNMDLYIPMVGMLWTIISWQPSSNDVLCIQPSKNNHLTFPPSVPLPSKTNTQTFCMHVHNTFISCNTSINEVGKKSSNAALSTAEAVATTRVVHVVCIIIASLLYYTWCSTDSMSWSPS